MLTLDKVKDYESRFISDPGGSNWHVSPRGEERLSSTDLIMKQLEAFGETYWKNVKERYLVLPEKSGLYTLCLAHKLTAVGYDLQTAIQEKIHVVPTNRLSLVRVKKVTGYNPTNVYELDTSVRWDASDYSGSEKLYAKYRPGTASYEQSKKDLPRPLVPTLFTLATENNSGQYSHLKLKPKMDRENLTVIGNPPWHEYDDGHGSSASPMEDKFVKLGERLGSSTCFVTPSRGLFGKGKGLKSYTDWMLNRDDIVSIKHWSNENSPFEEVDIAGGVSIIYTDENANQQKTEYNGEPVNLTKYDILVPEKSVYPVLDSVLQNADEFLDGEKFCGRGSVSTTGEKENMHSSRQSENDIVCYASQRKGFKNYVNPDRVNNLADSYNQTSKIENRWTVVTPRAHGSANKGFGNIFISKPNETCTSSYIEFEVDSAREAVSLRSYLKTDFVDFLLDKRKNSQDISGDTVKWIPVPPLDRIWTDEELIREELFGLSQEQWKQFTQQDD